MRTPWVCVFFLLSLVWTAPARALNLPLEVGGGLGYFESSFLSLGGSGVSYFSELGPMLDLRVLTTHEPKKSDFHVEFFSYLRKVSEVNGVNSKEKLAGWSYAAGVDVFPSFFFIGAQFGRNQYDLSGAVNSSALKHTAYGARGGVKFWLGKSGQTALTLGALYTKGTASFATASKQGTREVDELGGFLLIHFRPFGKSNPY